MQNLLDVYTAYARGDITIEEAATAYGTTPKNLRISLSKQGVKFPMMLSVLDKISVNAMTRDEAAVALGISVRSVNHLTQRWRVTRPIAQDPLSRATSQVKWSVQKKFAIDFIAGRISLDAASDSAKVHQRQMRRIVSRLIDKHLGMVYKDLGKMSITQLQRVARTIQQQEAITSEMERIAEEIASGRRSRTQEAVRQLLERRNNEPEASP